MDVLVKTELQGPGQLSEACKAADPDLQLLALNLLTQSSDNNSA